MPEITVRVTIRGGAGGVSVSIRGNLMAFEKSGRQTLTLEKGFHIGGVSGSAPPEGSVTITVLQGDNVLDRESFKSPVFAGFLHFEVE